MTTTRIVHTQPVVLQLDAESTSAEDKIDMRRLRRAIPDHCFQPSWSKSLYYIFRDVMMVVLLSTLAWTYVPNIQYAPLRCAAWLAYGIIQGLIFTGLWVIGHELGHGATLPSSVANNTFGFIIHSFLLTPYFAWRSTHRKHHRYTGHIDKDPDHVPVVYDASQVPKTGHRNSISILKNIDDYLEDAPLYVLSRLIFQQVFGWPMYLTFLIASGPDSYNYRRSKTKSGRLSWLQKCHFNPFSALFRDDETVAILISDIGVVVSVAALIQLIKTYGFTLVFLMYGQPYLWVNHWIVAITFLHHTHPDVPKYEDAAWTFAKGATATVDRDFGVIGQFFLHNITSCHVVHHLFTRIPFYHAPEATRAIRPLLGEAYREDKSNYITSLWREFVTCQWLVSDDTKAPEDRALWFVNSSRKAPLSSQTQHTSRLQGRLATWW